MQRMQRRLLSKLEKVVREPDHQFLKYMCETFQKDVDDPFLEEMDPIRKQWWYESWVYSIEKDLEKWKALGILIGSFSNPDAANKMMKKERPDFSTTDEEFERSYSMVENTSMVDHSETGNKRRRRRIIR